MILLVENGEIKLPEEFKKHFSDYISFTIKNGNIVLRMPNIDDKWEI